MDFKVAKTRMDIKIKTKKIKRKPKFVNKTSSPFLTIYHIESTSFGAKPLHN